MATEAYEKLEEEQLTNKVPLKIKMRPFIILGPAFLLTVGILIPFAMAIYFSVTNYSFKYPDYVFVGLENWISMFTSADFWQSVGVTLTYAGVATLIETLLGIGIAILLNRENFLSRSLRIVLIFPLVIAPVIATIIWQLMTNNSVGIYSDWLRQLGITNFNWGADPSTALFTVLIIDAWVFTPFVTILVLAGLRSLPKAPFESAMIDGGSAWFTFKNLTLPMIMPMLIIAILFRLMLSLQMFDIIFALTRGGPGDTLMTLPLTAYTEAFTYKELGVSLPFMLILWVFVYFLSHFIVKYWTYTQNKASGK
ncbi:carbohydrate ABC transporter membrane protein 1, CUT1 family (TC 3.A.1.1.-) [Gracilibacillus orientalis]|uniref:Carbohydrate ABC transporter membrane protein 1, CUT1 family (TC 3.A.1.1.-) n=1 Tax=Gracilibacillus orientalis TaxID=334253 RepID=A0A1I4NPC7_9BACI|nr:sugar ABC transporter permease [Gracilibacillus orientalis]SFM17167.1 carbohydrate ABC transporter membrane protein 1, CUT1 family (TC 3.A.1.1.-) [Gracilibacillus orientalis]